jgi:tetratricopeptide (TPR) repeat protein
MEEVMRQFTRILAAGVAAIALNSGFSAIAQVGGATLVAPIVAPKGAVERLLQNARHNIRNGRADLAFDQLSRVMKSDPQNAEAMMMLVVAYASSGDAPQAQNALAQLRTAHPGDANRIGVAQGALETGGKSGAGSSAVAADLGGAAGSNLEGARAAAAQGRYDEATKLYHAATGGRGNKPPPELAQEYYETLAGSPKGIKEARRGLRELYESRRDPKTGIAYARVLTYRQSTRRQGIDLLEQLSADQDPLIGAKATDGWGKALTWLGAKKSDIKRYDSYLARYPDDTAVQRAKDKVKSNLRKVQSGKTVRRDWVSEARASGFKLLDSGDTQGARERFEYALRKNSRDADALGGLGVIALREGRFAEASDYLSRAIARSRSSRSEWGEALASAEFWSAYGEADAARLNGDFAWAENIARSLVGRGGDDGKSVQILLGKALAGLGRHSEAEEAYRRAQQFAPGVPAVELGIFNALMGQNRQEEAFAFGQQMGPEAQQAVGQLSGLHASSLRDEALRMTQSGDFGFAASQLQQALSLDPNNPWIRLDLARLIAANGDVGQAFGLIDEMANSPNASIDMLQASAVFYGEAGLPDRAVAAAPRIPAEQQTADIPGLVERVTFGVEVARAKALAEAGAKRQAVNALKKLATRANTLGRQAQIATALAAIGEPHQALRMVRRQIAQSGGFGGDADSQVLYAGMLAQAGQANEAIAVVQQGLALTDLTASQRADLTDVQRGIAVKHADRATQSGAYADAYNILYPHLATSPSNPALLSALARIYSTSGHFRQAQTLYAQVLQQDPTDIGAMRGAIGAAIQAKDIRTASLLLDQAVKVYPSNPHIYFLMGEAARALGDRRTARRAFETARTLRQQEIAAPVSAGGVLVQGLPPNSFENVGLPSSNYGQQPAPGVIIPQGVNVPVSTPIGGANPFDRSSLDAMEINGEEEVTRLFGDAGDDNLLAQAFWENASTIIENTGSPSPVFQTANPDQGRDHQQSSSDVYLPAFVNPAERTQYAAPRFTEQIDDRLNEMNTSRGHYIQGGVALRARDGDGGLDRFAEVQIPASYTLIPQDISNFTLSATPVFVTSSSLEGGEASLRRFGTNPLVRAGPVPNPGAINTSGGDLSAAFEGGWIKGDAGVTPLGFEVINPAGGITFQPKLNEEVGLSFTLEQRAVTDSVLAYSGIEDTFSRSTFGGVVRRGATISGDIDTGGFGAYLSGGYYFLEGNNVQDNEIAEATVGAYNRVINRPDEELKLGLNATFFAYDQNLRHFTAGHNGYSAHSPITRFPLRLSTPSKKVV